MESVTKFASKYIQKKIELKQPEFQNSETSFPKAQFAQDIQPF